MKRFLALILAACTTTTTTTVTTPPRDAGADAPREDAGREAGADACTPPPDAVYSTASPSCEVLGSCPACFDGLLYRCSGGNGPGTWLGLIGPPAPLHSCVTLDPTGDYCCAPTCVVSGDHAAACGSKTPMECPADDMGIPIVTFPSGCTVAVPKAGASLFCCGS